MSTPLALRIAPLLRRYGVFGQWGQRGAVVYMCDGTTFHGGLCDRFQGIVSSYAYARATGRKFFIRYDFPFRLTEFLIPNVYDWQAEESDICQNMFGVCLRRFHSADAFADFLPEIIATKRQIHFYTNADLVEYVNNRWQTGFKWSKLFGELFRPTEELEASLNQKKKLLGDNYIGVHLRFQNLLGDFDEVEYSVSKRRSVIVDYPTLATDKRKQLIANACQSIEKIGEKHIGKKIFVASDSQTFLQCAQTNKDVRVFATPSIHIDYRRDDVSHADYLKVFEDFLLLARATHIYSVASDEMYKSSYPRNAARVYDHPFERIAI